MSLQKDVGEAGEDIVRLFLMKQGHSIVAKNALGYGFEIDIVSRYHGCFYFIEVKSVSHETYSPGYYASDRSRLLVWLGNVARGGWRILSEGKKSRKILFWNINETGESSSETQIEEWNNLLAGAADRVNSLKLLHVKRGIEILTHKGLVPDDAELSFEVITVMLDFFRKTAIIQRIPCEL
ncbi:MAG: YraN family protein [Patescibacteria group bacterium]